MTDQEVAETLRSICRDPARKHSEVEDAVNFVLRYLDAHPRIHDTLAEQILRKAITETVYDLRHADARTVKGFAVGNTSRGADVIGSVGSVLMNSMLDSFKMPDGKPLGDVLGSEMPAYIEMGHRSIHGWHKNVAFWEAIAMKVKGDVAVREKLSHEQAARIWKKVAEGRTGSDTHESVATATSNGVGRNGHSMSVAHQNSARRSTRKAVQV